MFIGLMTPAGAIWFKYQKVIIIFLQKVIKKPLKGNIPVRFMGRLPVNK